MKKRTVLVFALVFSLVRPANAVLTISVNGETMLPGSELSLNRGDEVVLEVTGDGLTSPPLEGFFFVEGPGSIAGHTLVYPGDAAEYQDLEQVAEAMGITIGQTLATFSVSTGRDLSDLAKWVLADSGPMPEPLRRTLMNDIWFRCEGHGDVLLTLETDDEVATYPDYTIVIHQTAVRNTYYVDASLGNDDNTGLAPEEAFATVQKAIDSAYDGEMVIVQPGLYLGDISFLGKNISLQSSDPNDFSIVEQTVLGSDAGAGELEAVITFQGTEDQNCRLSGFNINGHIRGSDGTENHARATISNCILCNNAGDFGTVIMRCDGLISHCTLADNNKKPGAGIHPTISECYGTIKNCTLANNTTGVGIGIWDGGTTEIINCILYNDKVAIYAGGAAHISYGNVAEVVGEEPSQADMAWGQGNISSYPFFVRLGNYSAGIVGDYHLRSKSGRWDRQSNTWLADFISSLSIDAGCPGNPLADEPAGPHNKRINMGAYGGTAEASKTPISWSLLADLTNDGIVDGQDFALQAKDCGATGEEKAGDLNRNGIVDMGDIEILIGAWLQTTTWH